MSDAQPITVLGVDVASRLKNIGVAHGSIRPGEPNVHIIEAAVGASPALPGRTTGSTAEGVRAVSTWLAERIPPTGRVVLALDAPLGWPHSLSRGLAKHVAGAPIADTHGPDRLWRRVTDQDVHARFGKLPLEVGANYIARAAWAGLEILRATRERCGRDFAVVLSPDEAPTVAIETYPAATLRSWLGGDPGSYKARDPEPRAALLERLTQLAPLTVEPSARAAALAVDHTFDAVICVLAGADFALGRTPSVPTEHHEMARTEGWIHVR